MHKFRRIGLAKSSLVVGIMVAAQSAMASYYYVDGPTAIDPEAVQYSTPDAACQAIYAADGQRGSPDPAFPVLPPYQSPILAYETVKFAQYSCDTSWQKSGDPTAVKIQLHAITRLGSDCADGQSYNQANGVCEKKEDELDRVENGNAASTVAGMCFVGDPINPAGGNIYEREVDYADHDGVLSVARTYNSRGSGWTLEIDGQLWFNRDGAAVVLPDGHTALFTHTDDAYIGEPGERGTLSYTGGAWTYVAPDTNTYLFAMAGQLSGIRFKSGRYITIARDTSNPIASLTTITDDQGRSAVFTYSFGRLASAKVGSLTISYAFDSSSRLSKVTRSWSGHTTSRQYLYEDAANTKSMTGLIDERGVRTATWAYDAQNRAISSAMPLSSGMVTVGYNTDGTTTVSNALGHSVTYDYQLVNGGRRISAIHGAAVAGCPAANSTFSYNVGGQMVTETNSRGQINAFDYDEQGREITRTEAKGTPAERVVFTTWDGKSFRPLTVTGPLIKTTYNYDTEGRLLSTVAHSVRD